MFTSYEESVLYCADDNGNLLPADSCKLLEEHGHTYSSIIADGYEGNCHHAESLLDFLGYWLSLIVSTILHPQSQWSILSLSTLSNALLQLSTVLSLIYSMQKFTLSSATEKLMCTPTCHVELFSIFYFKKTCLLVSGLIITCFVAMLSVQHLAAVSISHRLHSVH